MCDREKFCDTGRFTQVFWGLPLDKGYGNVVQYIVYRKIAVIVAVCGTVKNDIGNKERGGAIC